jgi:pimeloyl-ACP methyl ester carboxylesterase
MKTVWRWLLIILGLVLLLLLIGPFLIPIPPLKNTIPSRELADPDSQFAGIDGLSIHYKEVGAGEQDLLLLHGFAASTYSWREVLEPLSAYGRVLAYDRPAFGYTERPTEWTGANPYASTTQPDLAVGMMDHAGMDQAILVGNSAGGTVAMATALKYPERVAALILVDPAIYVGNGLPWPVRLLANTPQGNRLGPLYARGIQDWGYEFGRSAWHDPAGFTEEIWDNYTRPLQAENWDRALWEMFANMQPSNLEEHFQELDVPILVITGDDDRIVPTEQSIRLAGELPNAQLAVLPACGHIPQEECPEAFLEVVGAFLDNLAQSE